MSAHRLLDVGDQFKPFHPFGANFILLPCDGKIDTHEMKPYRRMAMKVED
jgi:hypothetical protein